MSPSYYLGAIQSDGSSKASFYIAVANSTLAGTYNLAVIATCQDSTGYRYSTSSNFSVTVESYSPPAVVITNVLVSPPVLTPGSSGSVTIFVKNTGTTEASNVVIQILGGSGIVSTDTFGLGTIEPGAQVTQVIGLNVIPGIKAGGYNMSFSATFTDPTGKVFHSSVPLQITVYKAPSLFTPLTIGALAVVVVVAMTSLFFLRRTKRF
ncbi:MAG: hypothetical protein M1368_09215 [Thaumarchaeota archaeon]|nr:hypothetical protein [Nitrososphaerota archaeon]